MLIFFCVELINIDSWWLFSSTFEFGVQPVEQLKGEFIMMHQLYLHELFYFLLAKLADTLSEEVSRALRALQFSIEDGKCHVKHNFA